MSDIAPRSAFACSFLVAAVSLGGCGAPARDSAAPVSPPDPQLMLELGASQPASLEPLIELSGNELVLLGPVVFETGSDVLKPESDTILGPVKRYLEAKTYVTLLRIEGHTDGDGDPEENQLLSERRALSVAHWLVAKGIDCRRLLPVGFGATKPIAPNDLPQNKAQNRRMAFVNAALRDRPIGGMPVDGGGTIAGDPCH